jgi:hypothetical protein
MATMTVATLAMATLTMATLAMATVAPTASVTAIATMTTVAGLGLLLTTQQGHSDDREENRDPKNENAIHPKILLRNEYLT